MMIIGGSKRPMVASAMVGTEVIRSLALPGKLAPRTTAQLAHGSLLKCTLPCHNCKHMASRTHVGQVSVAIVHGCQAAMAAPCTGKTAPPGDFGDHAQWQGGGAPPPAGQAQAERADVLRQMQQSLAGGPALDNFQWEVALCTHMRPPSVGALSHTWLRAARPSRARRRTVRMVGRLLPHTGVQYKGRRGALRGPQEPTIFWRGRRSGSGVASEQRPGASCGHTDPRGALPAQACSVVVSRSRCLRGGCLQLLPKTARAGASEHLSCLPAHVHMHLQPVHACLGV